MSPTAPAAPIPENNNATISKSTRIIIKREAEKALPPPLFANAIASVSAPNPHAMEFATTKYLTIFHQHILKKVNSQYFWCLIMGCESRLGSALAMIQVIRLKLY